MPKAKTAKQRIRAKQRKVAQTVTKLGRLIRQNGGCPNTLAGRAARCSRRLMETAA